MTRMNCILSLLLCTLMATGCEKPEPAPDPEPIVNPDPETPADPRDIPNDDGVLRVLAIGNSFSADAVEQELWPLFHAKGKKVIIGELYISGCDLQTHWERTSTGANAYSYRKISDESSGAMVTKADAKFEDGLQDERWDYISLQQGGGHHGQWETFEPWLSNMINYLREHAPYRKFKLVYHVPWVAPATSSSYKFGYYDYNTAKMYSMITETTKKVEEAIKPDLIINTVDAIQNGRSSYLGELSTATAGTSTRPMADILQDASGTKNSAARTCPATPITRTPSPIMWPKSARPLHMRLACIPIR